ncbi:LURP-one-related/scramblase family protein [Thalassotalea euphylliae]|uniref:LURP-one-related/scramblase family protein n=1 Tax=Thalassotalea euphylliae TaxID=1655234 RepID=UPI00362BE686
MRFVMKQKLLSLRDSFEIFDDKDRLAYVAKGKFFSLRKSLTVRDVNEREVVSVKQKLLAIKQTFFITFPDGTQCRIKKRFFPWITSRFIIKTPGADVEVTGDIFSHEYQFVAAGQLIAQVSKRWFSIGDTYGVDIAHEEDIPLVLAAVAIIDMSMHGDSGSIGSD